MVRQMCCRHAGIVDKVSHSLLNHFCERSLATNYENAREKSKRNADKRADSDRRSTAGHVRVPAKPFGECEYTKSHEGWTEKVRTCKARSQPEKREKRLEKVSHYVGHFE